MLALIQARMDSSRLPGKALLPLRGAPILEHVVRRVGLARAVTDIVVATSVEITDDPIVDWCEGSGVECARGPLVDVLARLVGIADSRSAPAFARISGDSPLIDPRIVDQAIALFCAADEPDLATNVWPRTFPAGQSIEVVRVQAAKSVMNSLLPLEREHVTAGLYRLSADYKIVSFTSGLPSAPMSMAVDTPEEYKRMAAVLATWEHVPVEWRTIVELGGARDF